MLNVPDTLVGFVCEKGYCFGLNIVLDAHDPVLPSVLCLA